MEGEKSNPGFYTTAPKIFYEKITAAFYVVSKFAKVVCNDDE